MRFFEFNDKMGHRSRECAYCIIHEGHAFNAKDAQENKLAVFTAIEYNRNGKWSSTTWRVAVKSAILVVCQPPWDGFTDDFDMCVKHIQNETQSYLNVEVTYEDAKTALAFLYPNVYNRLLEIKNRENDLI